MAKTRIGRKIGSSRVTHSSVFTGNELFDLASPPPSLRKPLVSRFDFVALRFVFSRMCGSVLPDVRSHRGLGFGRVIAPPFSSLLPLQMTRPTSLQRRRILRRRCSMFSTGFATVGVLHASFAKFERNFAPNFFEIKKDVAHSPNCLASGLLLYSRATAP